MYEVLNFEYYLMHSEEYYSNSEKRIGVDFNGNGTIEIVVYWKVPCPKFNGPERIEYYPNGNIKSETWYSKQNEKHRLDGPSYVRYYIDGSIEYEAFYIEGEKIEDPLEFYCKAGEYIED